MLIAQQHGGFGAGDAGDIVRDDLEFYFDAGDAASYPGSGTNWTDLINGYVLSKAGAGSFSHVAAGLASYFQFDGSWWFTQAAAYAGSLFRKMGRSDIEFTLEALLYRGATAGATEALFATITSGAHNGTDTYLNSAGNVPRFTPRPLGSNIDGAAQIGVGAWQQVALTGRPNGAVTCRWYTNAVANGAGGTINNSGWAAGDSSLTATICSAQSSSNFQNGSRIAILRGYSRALAADELAQNLEIDGPRYGI